MTKTLYVGNLPHAATRENLRALFTTDGREVAAVKLATNSQNGKCRGFGFVEMASEEQAAGAMLALQGTLLEGRPIKIGEARDRKVERASSYEDDYGGNHSGSGGGGKRRGRG